MRLLLLLGLLSALALSLSGCGGGAASASGPNASGPNASGPNASGSGTTGEPRTGTTGPDGCTGHDPGREAMCVSEGCRWGESLLCMGTPPPPDQEPRGARPCDCICPDDEEACQNVPSAPPGPRDE